MIYIKRTSHINTNNNIIKGSMTSGNDLIIGIFVNTEINMKCVRYIP